MSENNEPQSPGNFHVVIQYSDRSGLRCVGAFYGSDEALAAAEAVSNVNGELAFVVYDDFNKSDYTQRLKKEISDYR